MYKGDKSFWAPFLRMLPSVPGSMCNWAKEERDMLSDAELVERADSWASGVSRERERERESERASPEARRGGLERNTERPERLARAGGIDGSGTCTTGTSRRC